MTNNTKYTIANILPPLLGIGAGYYAYRNKTNWRILLVIVAVVWLASWFIFRKIVDAAIADSTAPKDIPINTGSGGINFPTNFDADRWATLFYDDVTSGIFTGRNHNLYEQVALMSNAQLAAISNAYKNLYYHEDKESLYQALQAEWISNTWRYKTATHRDIIVKKLKELGAV